MKKLTGLFSVLLALALIVSSVSFIPAVRAEADPTPAEAAAAFERIEDQMLSYARNNRYQDFAALFSAIPDASEEGLRDMFATIQAIDGEDLPKRIVHCIYAQDGYFICEALHYRVTGSGNNTQYYSRYLNMTIKQENGQWVMANLRDSDMEFAANTAIYGEKVMNAATSGRNCATFRASYLFVDSQLAMEGCVHQDVIYAYQNEDKSVDVGIALYNGTKYVKSFNKVSVRIQDSRLGTIVQRIKNPGIVLAPGTSTMYVMHVPADEVEKGTWSTLRYSLDVYYD